MRSASTSAIAKCVAVIAVAAAVGISAPAAVAQEAEPECPKVNPSYTGPCGPTFTLPSWGDAAGWTDPSKYSTIQLADVNGDGRDELLGRDDQGVEIWWFDTRVGQWRPQVNAKALPQVLHDLRSPLPDETGPTWTQPQYYSTIQAANLDGEPGDEVLARFSDGIHVYKYTPPAGGRAIDGGTWSLLNRGALGLFQDPWGWTDPSLYRTIQAADVMPDPPGAPRDELISRSRQGLLVYQWNGSAWIKGPPVDVRTNPITGLPSRVLASDDDGGQQPQYYTNIMTGALDSDSVVRPRKLQILLTRNAGGVNTIAYHQFRDDPAAWTRNDDRDALAPFADIDQPEGGFRVRTDCPFTSQSSDCLGTSPSFYETLQLADVDGVPGDELLARATDGLRVARADLRNGFVNWDDTRLPTHEALAGPASMDVYGTIQTANLDGKGGREVLALDGGGLQAWSYDAARTGWTKLTPSTPLELEGETWEDASKFSTIQAGDVDGDGRDDVIARGPFGVRTWFYNRRGTGGWESYLPHGYPAFTGSQKLAFDALTDLGHQTPNPSTGVPVIRLSADSVRGMWTGVTAPSAGELSDLQAGVLSLAKCSDPNAGNPPSFKTCTLPSGASGYDATDWTAVINEVLAEIFAARQAVTHFDQLDDMRQALMTSQGVEFPSIGADLHLQAAEADEVEYEALEYVENMFRIAGALAGLIPTVGEAAAAELEISAEVVGMVPSATPSFTKRLDATYAGLLRHFAESVDDLDKAQEVLSQEVRSEYGLATLVAQLRARGTWNPDVVGLKSVANRAFVLWTYQNLMTALYTRYQITNCHRMNYLPNCNPPGGTSRGVLGNPEGPDFTILGPIPFSNLHSPLGTPCGSRNDVCTYTALPSELNDKLFAPLTENCDYQPGTTTTKWTFKCGLGVTEKTSVDPVLGPRNGWTFFTWTGNPVARDHTATAMRVGSGSRMSLSGTIHVPRALDPARTRIRAARVLFEPAGNGELVHPRGGGAASSSAIGRRGMPVRLRGRHGRRLRFALRVARARVELPDRCQHLPTSVQSDVEPFRLHSRLRLSDGRRSRTVTLHHHWRCVQHRSGRFTRIHPVKPEAPPRPRPGLGISLRGPATVRAGTSARYRMVVTNRRRKPRGRNRTSLWHVQVQAATRRQAIVREIREVRRQQSKTRFVRVRIPQSATDRFCVTAVATADRAKSAGARVCAQVINASAAACAARSGVCATPIARRRLGDR